MATDTRRNERRAGRLRRRRTDCSSMPDATGAAGINAGGRRQRSSSSVRRLESTPKNDAGSTRMPRSLSRGWATIRAMKTQLLSALASLSVAALAAGTVSVSAQYSMTVNQDRLINAQNEPQNWLMMNGDYASTRYSKLTQINRDNVKNLRLVWAMALGGMQDVGQNGPEAEVHPLVDNGFLYTSDGWGTLYKIDARNPNKGEFAWVTDPGVKHQGNKPQTRGIALWEDLVIANLPDGRVIGVNRNTGEIVWDKMVATTNEFGSKERFNAAPIAADGKVIVANGAGDAKTRGWIAALDARTGNELWRWYVVPKPGDPGSETWKDTNNAWKTGGGGLWQTGSYDPKLDVQIYNPAARALRGDGQKRTCPTWHGGIAHQPTAYNPVKNIAYGVGIEGCFSQNGAAVKYLSPQGGIDEKGSEKRTYSSDLYYGSITAFDTVNHKIVAKAVTDIEVRSGATDTAGGVMFTALQDGWVVAYNDETLEQLWRFNVGTPLKGAAVTYAIGPKQYIAVQSGGRHLHPVKFDNLENSSYLFVFTLN